METGRANLVIGISVALVTAVAVAYAGVSGHEFLLFDDDEYVTENPMVSDGLSAGSVAWAFTSVHASNWHPVTWLSHMLDCSLFGLSPGPHHLVNVGFHALNAVLLFLALRSMTGAVWRSALVAGLFALHPLHVESVAWVAERKDVLSTTFWMLGLLAWTGYVRRPSRIRYAWVALALAVGLMAKPMLVTFPVVLLLLDAWPFARKEPWGALVIEKIPLLVLSVLSSAVTVFAQRAGGAVRSLESIPFPARLGNAVVAYATYLRRTLWPSELSAFYPYGPIPPGTLVLGAAVLAAVGLVVWIAAPRRPWLAVGTLWYAVTLVPVIGLVQVGNQSMADRYTYVPLIGIFLVVAWAAADLVEKRAAWRRPLVAAAIVVLAACTVATARYARYFESSERLFRRAIAVTTSNWLAQNNLATALAESGRPEEAIEHYREAIRIRPAFAEAQGSLGTALLTLGRPEEAVLPLREADALRPDPVTKNNLGIALSMLGRLDEAIPVFEAGLDLAPGDPELTDNLARARAIRSRTVDENLGPARR